MFLISAENYRQAQWKAMELQLSPNQWRYIPWERLDRSEKLRGYSNFLREELIGAFDDEEIFCLTGRR